MTKALLQAQDVHKHFRRLHVLRGASLRIEPGEVVGLVGENGSGKTTFMNILVGFLRRDSGMVEINCPFAYCPQEPLVFDSLTMVDNIRYFSAAYGLAAAAGLARGEALMERFNCCQFEDRPVGVLSGGTRQKLNLIIALLRHPALLFLDEPYQGFDYESYLVFWEMAREMAADGRSALVVSHMVHDQSHFSRIYHMKDGRTIHDEHTENE